MKRNECAVRAFHTLYLEMTWEQHSDNTVDLTGIYLVSDKCVVRLFMG